MTAEHGTNELKIGLLGGTFDPIHLGHLILAELACETLKLDRLLFILSSLPPHKTGRKITPVPIRLEMMRAAIAGNELFEVSTVEVDRQGPSFTVDTLRALKKEARFRNASLYFLIGTDNLVDFNSWRSPEEILKLATLVVYPRQGYRDKEVPEPVRDRYLSLDLPLIEISSTAIRKRVSTDATIRYLVPDPVLPIIAKNHLYRS